jgi:heme A synthase
MILFVGMLLAGTKRRREPGAEQWMALVAYAAVGFQALMGTLRVNMETAGAIDAAVNLRTFHGIFAQGFLVLLVALATRLSPVWWEITQRPSIESAPRIRRMAMVALCIYFAQLSCAAYLRHRGLGLVIPTWPRIGEGGGFLPAGWNHAIAIHFLHSRVLPIVLTGHLIGMAIVTARRASHEPRLTRLSWGLLALVLVQFFLGVMVIWKGRQPHITNTHVITGALICATAALLVTRAGRLSHFRGS